MRAHRRLVVSLVALVLPGGALAAGAFAACTLDFDRFEPVEGGPFADSASPAVDTGTPDDAEFDTVRTDTSGTADTGDKRDTRR
jgi:hypothetical protein